MLRVIIAFCWVLCFGALSADAKTDVDLALVLAADTSGSVDGSEYDLQLGGIAKAMHCKLLREILPPTEMR